MKQTCRNVRSFQVNEQKWEKLETKKRTDICKAAYIFLSWMERELMPYGSRTVRNAAVRRTTIATNATSMKYTRWTYIQRAGRYEIKDAAQVSPRPAKVSIRTAKVRFCAAKVTSHAAKLSPRAAKVSPRAAKVSPCTAKVSFCA